MKLSKLTSTLLILALMLAMVPAQSVYAASFTASTFAELETAINTANGNGVADEITLTANITLTSALPTLTSDITIHGAGFTLDGDNAFQVLHIIGPSATVVLNNITITKGYSAGMGGGIRNSGSLTLNNSTVSGNSGGSGGGISNFESTLTLNNSTVSGNSATNHGGGIYNDNTFDPVTLNLNHSTITNNTADSDSNGSGEGGGIFHMAASTVNFNNSIVAGNTSNNTPANNDCIDYGGTGTQTSEGYNIIGNNDGCSVPAGTGDNFGTTASPVNANLATLADNGGDTKTHALNTGSPALDQIPSGTNGCGTTYTTDQRGETRPFNSSCDIGAYELQAVDTTPPTKTTSVPADGASYATGAGPTSLTVTFDEDVKSGGGITAADYIPNYLLVEAGVNGTFDTATCLAGVVTDDTKITITNAAYTSTGYKATLTLGSALPAGKYRLFACGTTSIEDLAGNELNGGSDTQINFTVQAAVTAPAALPKTGFAMGRTTTLEAQPESKAYTETAMLLEIPKLGVSMPIVGVPQSENGWDVNWLGNSAGYLAGSAFPTWAGNTVITGHVWDAYNNPGAFSDLKTLKYGDQVQIQAWGQTYTYEVRESNLVTKKNVSAVLQSEEFDWVTLVTCEFYNPFTGDYLFRRAVRAVLVNVK